MVPVLRGHSRAPTLTPIPRLLPACAAATQSAPKNPKPPQNCSAGLQPEGSGQSCGGGGRGSCFLS